MMGSIIGLLSSVIGGAISSSANKKYQKTLQDELDKQKLPDSLGKADLFYSDQAGRGSPYFEQQKAEIDTSVPTTLNQARDYMQGGGMVDLLTNLYSSGQKQHRQLNQQNEMTRMGNEQRYAQFLSGPMAGAEQNLSDTTTLMALAKGREEKQRSKDSLAFAQQGANSLDLTSLLGSEGLSDMIAGIFSPKTKSGVGQNMFGSGQDYGISSGQGSVDPMFSTGQISQAPNQGYASQEVANSYGSSGRSFSFNDIVSPPETNVTTPQKITGRSDMKFIQAGQQPSGEYQDAFSILQAILGGYGYNF